ncbi:hypothetical protein [Cellulosimicrobium sp. NPDC057127]|uniref:hypothetical protein n=1 Tax=Cellulosimicrobium sp. NPDC057127 TaxID=3346026 RepID=UPI00363056B5
MSEQAPTLTPPQERALVALRDLCDELVGTGQVPAAFAAPREVAYALWPDSPGWAKRSRRRDGAGPGSTGATMPMKAATLLWRLLRHGLAAKESRVGGREWYVTDAGRKYLEHRDL